MVVAYIRIRVRHEKKKCEVENLRSIVRTLRAILSLTATLSPKRAQCIYDMRNALLFKI